MRTKFNKQKRDELINGKFSIPDNFKSVQQVAFFAAYHYWNDMKVALAKTQIDSVSDTLIAKYLAKEMNVSYSMIYFARKMLRSPDAEWVYDYICKHNNIIPYMQFQTIGRQKDQNVVNQVCHHMKEVYNRKKVGA